MHTSRTLTLSLAAALVFGAMPSRSMAQTQTTVLRGTAKDEAKQPYTDFTVQARELERGQMSNSVPLDQDGNFSLKGLPVQRYMIELIDSQGRVSCTEGPFEVTTNVAAIDVVLNCGHVPVGVLILGAAAAGGAVAGASVDAPASGSR